RFECPHPCPVDPLHPPWYLPPLLALAIPSAWRSRRTSVSKAANTASMPKKARPAEVEVSTCCSSTLRLAPAASISCAMLARSRMERPRRSPRHHQRGAGARDRQVSGPVFLTASANRHRFSTTEVGFRSYFSPYVIRPLRLPRSARQSY